MGQRELPPSALAPVLRWVCLNSTQSVVLTRSVLPAKWCTVYTTGLHLAPDALDVEFPAFFHYFARKIATEESDGDSDVFSDYGVWNNALTWDTE